jgi:hypothetical protein
MEHGTAPDIYGLWNLRMARDPLREWTTMPMQSHGVTVVHHLEVLRDGVGSEPTSDDRGRSSIGEQALADVGHARS